MVKSSYSSLINTLRKNFYVICCRGQVDPIISVNPVNNDNSNDNENDNNNDDNSDYDIDSDSNSTGGDGDDDENENCIIDYNDSLNSENLSLNENTNCESYYIFLVLY